MSLLDRLRGRDAKAQAEPARRCAADCRKELAGVLGTYQWGIRGAIVVGALALLFTMINVQIFGSAGHQPGAGMASTFLWVIAWLLDPMASIGLGVAILFESLLARYKRRENWLTGVKWFAGVMTWTMNIWPAIDQPHPSGLAAGVVLHSLAPGLVLGLAEAAPRVRRQVSEILDALEREAQAIEAREAAERVAERQQQAAAEVRIPAPAPIPPPAPPLSTFPGRAEFTPAVSPTGRPGDRRVKQAAARPAGRPDPPARADPTARSAQAGPDRTSPARRVTPARERTARPRTDAQLAPAIRDLTKRNGGLPPSQYQLRQALGVGSGRAARLVAELDPAPAAPPAGNGTATRKDDTP